MEGEEFYDMPVTPGGEGGATPLQDEDYNPEIPADLGFGYELPMGGPQDIGGLDLPAIIGFGDDAPMAPQSPTGQLGGNLASCLDSPFGGNQSDANSLRSSPASQTGPQSPGDFLNSPGGYAVNDAVAYSPANDVDTPGSPDDGDAVGFDVEAAMQGGLPLGSPGNLSPPGSPVEEESPESPKAANFYVASSEGSHSPMGSPMSQYSGSGGGSIQKGATPANSCSLPGSPIELPRSRSVSPPASPGIASPEEVVSGPASPVQSDEEMRSTPASPVNNLSAPASPDENLSGPASPVENLSAPASPDLSTPASPVENLSAPASPVENLSAPASPDVNMSAPASPDKEMSNPASPVLSMSPPASPDENISAPASPTNSMSPPASPTHSMSPPASPIGSPMGSHHSGPPASPSGSGHSRSVSPAGSRSRGRSHSPRSGSGSPGSHRSRSGSPCSFRSGSGSRSRSRSRSRSGSRSSRSGSRSSYRSRSGSRGSYRSRSGSRGSYRSRGGSRGSYRSRSGSRGSRSGSGRSRSGSRSRSVSPAGSMVSGSGRSRSPSPAGSMGSLRSDRSAGSRQVGGKKRIKGSDDEESDKESHDGLIADIFGSSDEEGEFEGFDAADVEAHAKKDKKKQAIMSDDEDAEAGAAPAEGEGEAQPQLSSGDENADGLRDDKPDFVSDFDVMMSKKKEEMQKRRKKRRDVDIINDNDDLIAALIQNMRQSAEDDRQLNLVRKPAVQKLKFLPSVMQELRKADLQESFLECGILGALTEWIAPLPDKSLPHFKIRHQVLHTLATFPPVNAEFLKNSGIGKAVMYLYKHPKEDRKNKTIAGKLINDWSRPIFNLTANYKTLTKDEREQRDYEQLPKKRRLNLEGGETPRRDIDKALAGDEKGVRPGDPGWVMRARVPQPSVKDYVIRPKWNNEEQPRKSSKKTANRYEKHVLKFAEKARNKKDQKAVFCSLEGRNMAL